MKTSQNKSKLPIFYVYAIVDPTKPGPFYYGHWKFSHEPFYVGKGHGGRTSSHLAASHNPIVFNKIIKFRRSRLEPIVTMKSVRLFEPDALKLETRLITKIGRRDLKTGPLCNLTSGGDGLQGSSKITRNRISESVKKKWKNGTYNSRLTIMPDINPFSTRPDGSSVSGEHSRDRVLRGVHNFQGIKPWDHPNATIASKVVWFLAKEIYNIWIKKGTLGYVSFSRHCISELKIFERFGVTPTVDCFSSILRYFSKHIWIPKDDPVWIKFRKRFNLLITVGKKERCND